MRGPRRGHGWRVLSRGGADAGPHRWRPTAVAALEVRPHPPDTANLVWMQQLRGRTQRCRSEGMGPVCIQTCSQSVPQSGGQTPGRRLGHVGKHSEG